ncbi:MAG: DUF1579 family protein [Prolixibacteraceae bacterium]|nr:DUF1579 family protein [Burkholderiales bacterium]
MKRILLGSTVTGAVLLAATAWAQTGEGTAAKPCATPQHRQFDFWIGEWDVTQNGKSAGRNSIRPILNGCALSEQWSGTGGFTGSSLNFYDEETKRWHQTWIDSQGQSLMLEGSFSGGAMVLQTIDRTPDGPQHRITWTLLDGRSVRQLWQTQEKGGAEWKTAFDGKYTLRSN